MIALADKSCGKLFTRYSVSAEQTHHWFALKSSQIPCLSPFGQNERRAGWLPTANSSALLRSATVIQPGTDKGFCGSRRESLYFSWRFLSWPWLISSYWICTPRNLSLKKVCSPEETGPEHHRLERRSLKEENQFLLMNGSSWKLLWSLVTTCFFSTAMYTVYRGKPSILIHDSLENVKGFSEHLARFFSFELSSLYCPMLVFHWDKKR